MTAASSPPGKAADLTIFDADTIASKPREPVDYPPAGANAKHVRRGAIGIDYVIVNGEVLLEDGEHTGALPRPGPPGALVPRLTVSPEAIGRANGPTWSQWVFQ